jgi:hypothetical protein
MPMIGSINPANINAYAYLAIFKRPGRLSGG